MTCPYCNEKVLASEDLAPGPDGRLAHRECGFRAAVGGIGHLLDHDRWCQDVGDPDMGLTWRESSRRVAVWVQEHGLDAAIARGRR